MKLYVLSGGIGKQFLFTSMIKELTKKEKIAVVSPYPDLFQNHPMIEAVYSQDNSKDFYKYFDEIIYREPYNGTYLRGETHLLKEWAKDYGIKEQEHKGVYYPSEQVTKGVDEILEQIPNDFIILQFTGGQPPQNFEQKQEYQINDFIQGRNYDFNQAVELVKSIKDEYPNTTLLQYGLPNEGYDFKELGVERLTIPYVYYIELLKSEKCKTFIGIDSSLQHFARASDKKGIVLWGETKSLQVGYIDFHINMNTKLPMTVRIEPSAIMIHLNALYDEDIVTPVDEDILT